jgi:serine protease Do
MLSSLIVAAACLMPLAAADSDVFSQTLLEQAYRQVTPAIGVVEYSLKVTNPKTGEVSQRDNSALALVVAPDGLVMAHGHMDLQDAHPFNISVTLGRGSDEEKKFEATLLKKPDELNVVFLHLKSDKPLNLPCVHFSAANDLKLGSLVAMYGLLSETLDFNCGVFETRVSSVLDKPRTTYCLDQNVRFGCVGGPVIDTQGRVVGVVGFDLSREEGGELYTRSGQPLLYQTALFQKYIETPLGNPTTEAYLGVFTQPLTDDLAEYWGMEKNGGMVISTVVPESPGATAGLQSGDIITALGNTPIHTKLDRDVVGFSKIIRDSKPGDVLAIKLLRGGKPMDMQVTLGVRPRSSRDANEYEDKTFGLTVRELTQDLRIALNLASDVQGVIVRQVRSGSPAQFARMGPGIIVMGFGGHPVKSIDEFKEAVSKVCAEKPAEVPVFARAGQTTGFFRLEPRWEK